MRIDSYTPDVLSCWGYYPFGSLMPGRNASSGDYRYGFNGMEQDIEVKNNPGNHYDFGARVYDPRLGRFFSTDPFEKKFSFQSPYLFASNTPIVAIDEDGKYSVWRHYRLTKKAMLYLGYSRKIAKRIAHYSSTYADNPTDNVLLYNQIMIGIGVESYDDNVLKYDKNKYGTYDLPNSQSDENLKMVSIHAMRGWFEDISEEEAVDRALYGGKFLDVNGDEVTIVGAYQVIESLYGKNLENLTIEEQKALGVALHTIQDAVSHLGKRWVDKHKEEAKKKGYENEHPNFNEQGRVKGYSKALTNTLKVLRRLKKEAKGKK